MVSTTDLITDFDAVMAEWGTTVTTKFFRASGTTWGNTGSAYDDVVNSQWIQSGANISGVAMIQPLNKTEAGDDYKMVEQGILRFGDRKIFLTGSLMSSQPTNSKVRFAVGGRTWELLPEGLRSWEVSGTTIYWSGFIREFNS